MPLLDQIKFLETLSDADRYKEIIKWLKKEDIVFETHTYATGRNIVISPPVGKSIGIGSHFDTVPITPGANDNLSAVVIALALAKRERGNPLHNLGLSVFIFDEEERGLKGSDAFLKEHGYGELVGLLNMEMMGRGNQFAIWPTNQHSQGKVLEKFEAVCAGKGIKTGRYDRIVMNSADHESFRKYGLSDSFTITCISDKDVEVAYHYYRAMEFAVDHSTLYEIMSQAPIFEHYHQPSDTSEHLSEEALQMSLEAIWDTVQELDRAHPVVL